MNIADIQLFVRIIFRKRIVCFMFLFPFLVSCISTSKGSFRTGLPEYINKEGYKNLYVVDTIQIDSPIRFFTKRGYQFVMSQKAFQRYDGNEKLLFDCPSAFLLEDGLPMQLPADFFSKYVVKGSSDCIEYSVMTQTQKKKIDKVYSYIREPDFFLLILIRGDYYNQVYSGIDGPPQIKSKNNKFVYYKVAIPYCIEK